MSAAADNAIAEVARFSLLAIESLPPK